MSLKLIGVTRPTDEMMTTSDLIAYCARVSNPSNQANKSTAPKLIDYLIRERHWSPLEMVNVVMEIETTRDIARQILRHRSFSFQEFSQRYANPTELGFKTREALSRLMMKISHESGSNINCPSRRQHASLMTGLWIMVLQKSKHA
jgi:flavin-dependent thymidylate synthase